MRLPRRVRRLTDAEWAIVARVFGAASLPGRDRIRVTDGLGLGRRAFVVPTALAAILLGVPAAGMAGALLGGSAAALAAGALAAGAGFVASGLNRRYWMNVGPAGFAGMERGRLAALLVHETAHVWQGFNARFALSYVAGSAAAQLRRGLDAYAYEPGGPWGRYNPEQQASVIEHWFAAGEREDDPRFPYLRDHVRRGRTR